MSVDSHILELLCESCGYSILSLPQNGACPECGRKRAMSLPESREGTHWQKQAGVGSWCRTVHGVTSGPDKYFDKLQICAKGGRALLVLNLGIAAVFLAHPLVGVLRFDPASGVHEIWTIRGLLAIGLSASVLWAAALVLFSALTMIEYLGIRFFAARRQWRLLPNAAMQICAHASCAWIVAALLTIVGLSLSSMLPQLGTTRAPATFWEEVVRAARFLLPGVPPLIGFAIGLIWFEWLVYKGVSSCKFANAFEGDATLGSERTKG